LHMRSSGATPKFPCTLAVALVGMQTLEQTRINRN